MNGSIKWEPNLKDEEDKQIRDWRGMVLSLNDEKPMYIETETSKNPLSFPIVISKSVSNDMFHVIYSYIPICPMVEAQGGTILVQLRNK